MEYSELADYAIRSGRLTEWRLDAPEGWKIDDRALAFGHERHVERAAASPDEHRGSWIGTAFEIGEPLDAQTFAATVEAWVSRHEAFRTTATPDDDGRMRRWTVGPDRVRVTASAATDVLGGAEISDRLGAFFAADVTAVRWPHLALATVADPSDTAFTVVFAADHAVMDAYTQVLAIAELSELYRAIGGGRAPTIAPCGSYVDYSVAERDTADALDAAHPAVTGWRAFLGADGLPSFPLPVRSPRETVPGQAPGQQAGLSSWVLDAAEADAFVAAAKGFGGSQTSGFLAAVKVAFARLGAPVARYLMPMHTRNSAEYAMAAGWFVGVMPVDDRIGDSVSFAEAVPVTAQASRVGRDLVPFPFARVADLLGIADAPQFVVSFVDARFLPGADAWTENDRALRSRARGESEVYLWINRAVGGVNVSMRYPNNEVAAASVHAFVAELSSVFSAVAHGRDACTRASGAPVDGGLR